MGICLFLIIKYVVIDYWEGDDHNDDNDGNNRWWLKYGQKDHFDKFNTKTNANYFALLKTQIKLILL